MSTYVVGGQWDETRNSSRVFPVPPDALPSALKAMAANRRANPEHCAWLDAGAPAIHSEEEHVRWFGCTYDTRRKRARE